jgi:curved DNA-binding protein CbpA
LALTCHPDKNPGVPDIEKKFADMSRAYKLLLDYSRAFSRAEHDEGLPLDERVFEKNAILVTTLG